MPVILEQEVQSSGEEEPMLASSPVLRHRRYRVKAICGGGLVGGLLVLGIVVGAVVRRHSDSGPSVDAESVDETSELIEVTPPADKCSKAGELCSTTKCCTITGYKCYQKNAAWAGCLKTCPPKVGTWSCERPADLVSWKPSAASPGTTLFCFEAYTADTGSTKKTWELSLIRTQLMTHASIFGCEDWEVFSDVATWLTPTPPKLYTVKIKAPHYGKRPKTGSWLNAGFYHNIWAAIKEGGKAAKNDWSVKVDPDCVWLPSRLRTKLSKQEVTDNGIYLTNCRHVKYGFFGSIAVASKKAAMTYMDNLEDCKSTLNWGKWGEDLFEQRCMDLHGVDNVEDFTVVTDGVCDAIEVKIDTKAKKKTVLPPDCTKGTPAFHPLKTPEKYFTCLAATGER